MGIMSTMSKKAMGKKSKKALRAIMPIEQESLISFSSADCFFLRKINRKQNFFMPLVFTRKGVVEKIITRLYSLYSSLFFCTLVYC